MATKTKARMSGPETFEAVKALIDQGMSRKEAFDQVGKQTGRESGTVATAFYRIARTRSDSGVQHRPRNGNGVSAGSDMSTTSTAPTAPKSVSGDEFDVALANLTAATSGLATAVREVVTLAKRDHDRLVQAEAIFGVIR